MASNCLRRALVFSMVLMAVEGLPHGALDGGSDTPIPIPQQCDGVGMMYTVPGGTATGTGTSASRAKRDANHEASNQMDQSCRPCDVCSDGWECPSSISWTWINGNFTTPVQDQTTGMWSVDLCWDGCVIIQTCNSCSPNH